MAFLAVNGVRISGMAACVPRQVEEVRDIYSRWGGEDDFRAFLEGTHVARRHVAPRDVCTSDLCVAAAERLITELGWDKSEIDVLLLVTQTPDYLQPPTACILQDRLGLGTQCYAFDIELGCSGWVYGLSAISALMQGGTMRKGLLMVGDTPLKNLSPNDQETWPLFGDAASVTALEYRQDSIGGGVIQFALRTDGSGFEDIIIRRGGYRTPVAREDFTVRADGSVESPCVAEMDGMNVFSFGISKAPKVVRELCGHFHIGMEDIDLFTFHQANYKMDEKIRTKLGVPPEKVSYCMEDYGNTAGCSIPLALISRRRPELTGGRLRHIACGFGIGLSWGAACFETDGIVVPDIVEL